MTNARLLLDALVAAAALTTALLFPTPPLRATGIATFIHPAKAAWRPAKTLSKSTKSAESTKSAALSRKRPTATTGNQVYTVTATAYQAVPGQTDDEPFVTADNSRIKPHYGSRKRWLALSTDLLKRWGGHFEYGDMVRVRGISPKLDGVYTVHDTMNRRHRHCMDVLTHPSEKIDIFTKGVKIQKVAF